MKRQFLKIAIVFAFVSGMFPFQIPQTFAAPQAVLTVTVAGDYLPGPCDSSCTLRDAITAANATHAVKETIRFNIPTNSANCDSSTGVCTITLLGALPLITDPVVIDGYSQPGAHPNTLSVGDDADLRIVLDGKNTSNIDGLYLGAGDSTVQGLVIQHFKNQAYAGIEVASDNNIVQGNFIGTDAAGTIVEGNYDGVSIDGKNNLVGGTTPQARNLISGNAPFGIHIWADGNVVQGNYIGTDHTGLNKLPNGTGVFVWLSGHNTIGGKGAGARNIISGNSARGVMIGQKGSFTLVRGNWIGLAANKSPLGNSSAGVYLYGSALVQQYAENNTIMRNVIAHNGAEGVAVGSGADDYSNKNAFTHNAIYGNGGLGIDLYPYFLINPNDAHDADNGPNDAQNHPVLKSVIFTNGVTTIKGTLQSEAQKSYQIELFLNPTCVQGTHSEGKKYLGRVKVTTTGKGKAKFILSLHKPLMESRGVTATATEMEGTKLHSTSEFSNCVLVP